MILYRLLFKCIACDEAFLAHRDPKSGFPLCRLCQESLLPAPEQCSVCGRPECFAFFQPSTPSLNSTFGVATLEHKETNAHPRCIRPWRALSGIHSFSARYMMMGQGYEVLKKWKKQSGLLFDRQILRATPELIQRWRDFKPQRVVPIPQRFNRAWILKGSRTREIANWVGQSIQVPYVNALCLMAKNSAARDTPLHQAQLGLKGRMLNRIPYEVLPANLKGIQRIILVDDFMTSGRTLRQAADVLLQHGVEEIHCFCLGLRAQRTHLRE